MVKQKRERPKRKPQKSSSAWPAVLCLALFFAFAGRRTAAESEAHKVLIRDVATVEGVRDNSLVGYGLVVGLKGTGDKQQTYFTVQTLASILARMGVQIPSAVLQSTVQVKNVAAVFVTASLPPFSRPGIHLDVIVSSIGDARSLEGGLLLLSPLYAADGQVYAAAQGPVVVGGYTAGSATNAKQVNHPTVGRVPGGALVERDSSLDLAKLDRLSLLLNDANFSTAEDMASVINQALAAQVATVIDSRRVDIQISKLQISKVQPAPIEVAQVNTPQIDAAKTGAEQTNTAATADEPTNVPALLARIENLEVEVRRRAKVVVNERTGTVVLGQDVHLGAVSILHGNFSIEVTTAYTVSQPNPLSNGQTEVVPQTKVTATETPARNIALSEGASVEQLVARLEAIGATARDVVSILQAIKAAGALDADLEVI
jgi:flagellar P-ring protein FlgI